MLFSRSWYRLQFGVGKGFSTLDESEEARFQTIKMEILDAISKIFENVGENLSFEFSFSLSPLFFFFFWGRKLNQRNSLFLYVLDFFSAVIWEISLT
jgi:hypothetical protein